MVQCAIPYVSCKAFKRPLECFCQKCLVMVRTMCQVRNTTLITHTHMLVKLLPRSAITSYKVASSRMGYNTYRNACKPWIIQSLCVIQSTKMCPVSSCINIIIICTSSFARFARSATSPSFAYVSNPAPDSSLCRAAAPRLCSFSCCSPIVLFPVPSAAARHLRSLQLLLPDFNSSPIASASAAAPRLRPL